MLTFLCPPILYPGPVSFISGFLDEIMDWAKGVLNRLPSEVRKAGVYIKCIPGAVKVFVKTFLGKEETTKSELTREDIEQMVRYCILTKQSADDILAGREVHIVNIERD